MINTMQNMQDTDVWQFSPNFFLVRIQYWDYLFLVL